MSENLTRIISDNWTTFNQQLEDYCIQIGRGVPKVIAVSKAKSVEYILAAIDAGISEFGESYAQEFSEKANAITKKVVWHFIGKLQRRNAKLVINYASVIHSVDSFKLLNRLAHLNYNGKILFQINISNETTKSGVRKDKLHALIKNATQLSFKPAGIMVIGHPLWKTQQIVDEFAKAKKLGRTLLGKETLFSAGMSNDWREAVQAGSTHLRIGSVIFGKREK